MFGRKKSPIDQATETAQKTMDTVQQKAPDVVESVAENVKDAATAINRVATAASAIATAAARVADAANKSAAADNARSLSDKAAQAGQNVNLAQAAQTIGQKAADVTKNVDLSKAAEKVGETAGSAAGQATEFGAVLRDRAAALLSALMSQSQQAANQASKSVADAHLDDKANEATKTSTHVLETVLSTLLSGAGGAKNQVTGIHLDQETIARIARGMILIGSGLNAVLTDKSGTVGGGPLAEAPEKAQHMVAEAASAGKDSVNNLAELSKEFLSMAADTIIEAVERTEQKSKQAIDQARERLIDTTDTVADRVSTVASNAQQIAQPAMSTSQRPVTVPAPTAGGKKEKGKYGLWFLLGLIGGIVFAFVSDQRSQSATYPTATSTPAEPLTWRTPGTGSGPATTQSPASESHSGIVLPGAEANNTTTPTEASTGSAGNESSGIVLPHNASGEKKEAWTDQSNSNGKSNQAKV